MKKKSVDKLMQELHRVPEGNTVTEPNTGRLRFTGEHRKPDLPVHKEKVMSVLYGEVLGFLKSSGLTRGEQFDSRIDRILECSKMIIWVDRYHPTMQLTFYFNTISMSLGFGVVKKDGMEVLLRVDHKNLRYKISEGSELELIDMHQKMFDSTFEQFQKEFTKLREEVEK